MAPVLMQARAGGRPCLAWCSACSRESPRPTAPTRRRSLSTWRSSRDALRTLQLSVEPKMCDFIESNIHAQGWPLSRGLVAGRRADGVSPTDSTLFRRARMAATSQPRSFAASCLCPPEQLRELASDPLPAVDALASNLPIKEQNQTSKTIDV